MTRSMDLEILYWYTALKDSGGGERQRAFWTAVASEYQKYSFANIQLIVIHWVQEREKKKAKLVNIVTKKSNLHDH